MKNPQSDRRKFIKHSIAAAASLAVTALPLRISGDSLVSRPVQMRDRRKEVLAGVSPIRFAAIGLNHDHIYNLVEVVIRSGGQLISFYGKEAALVETFSKRYPQAKLARNVKEILGDNSIQLVVSASIPSERAPLGIEVMRHGKDFMADKPGIVTLQQLDEVKRVQRETKRIYAIMYGRFESGVTVKAGELVKSGAIGQVIQTIGLGPHRLNLKSRPEWFFDHTSYGGIICDIGSHQCDEFLFLTGSTKAEVVVAHVGNVHHPQYPGLEDFGDTTLRGDGGMGYMRVDWFTPDGLNTWGDDRLTVLGTEGFMELRKNVDIAGRAGGNHLFVVDNKETRYFDCSKEPLPFGDQLVNDILNRTETAMSQEHCFLATELALKAQKQAQTLAFKK